MPGRRLWCAIGIRLFFLGERRSRRNLRISGDPLRIDAYWTMRDGRNMSVDVDAPCGYLIATYTHTRRREMTRIRIGLWKRRHGNQRRVLIKDQDNITDLKANE